MKQSRGSRPIVQQGQQSMLAHNGRATAPITLLTDFGTSDYYVGAVKAVIFSRNPAVTVVDITHEIPPQDIEAAAFVLLACYRSFPIRTINLVVVDPGVGSVRRAIVVKAGERIFVGPDNGVFSYVLDHEPNHRVIQITAQEYFQQPLSNTFHGRDLFAPIAAALSQGVSLKSIGSEINDPVRLPSLQPVIKNRKVKGRIIHIDRFGNCVTNLTKTEMADGFTNGSLSVNGTRIASVRAYYGEGKQNKSLFAIWGSAGFLEISTQNRSAAKILKAKRGDEVLLLMK